MSQRFEGKNLEEALTSAAETYGVERYQLTYHVLVEKRGFLGGMKRVVIEAEVNEAPAAAVVEPTAPPPAEYQPREPGGRRPGRGDRKRGGGGGGRQAGRRGEREGGGRHRRDEEGRDSGRDRAQIVWAAEEVPEQTPESEVAQAVRGWLEQVLTLTALDLQVRTEENETQVLIRLYGADGPKLLDRHGELLDALQVLANKSLGSRNVEKDIEVDCQKFKERRLEELGQKARETADRVRRDGREQLLPAMSPIERRIVHLALQDDEQVATESRGDGFYKRVAIIPRPSRTETPAAGEP